MVPTIDTSQPRHSHQLDEEDERALAEYTLPTASTDNVYSMDYGSWFPQPTTPPSSESFMDMLSSELPESAGSFAPLSLLNPSLQPSAEGPMHMDQIFQEQEQTQQDWLQASATQIASSGSVPPPPDSFFPNMGLATPTFDHELGSFGGISGTMMHAAEDPPFGMNGNMETDLEFGLDWREFTTLESYQPQLQEQQQSQEHQQQQQQQFLPLPDPSPNSFATTGDNFQDQYFDPNQFRTDYLNNLAAYASQDQMMFPNQEIGRAHV